VTGLGLGLQLVTTQPFHNLELTVICSPHAYYGQAALPEIAANVRGEVASIVSSRRRTTPKLVLPPWLCDTRRSHRFSPTASARRLYSL
jgi:hypothetical protein